MKRLFLVASLLVGLGASAAFLPSGVSARPAPSPSPSAAPIPTPTPEPPSIAIPRLQAAVKANPNDRQALAGLAMQYLQIGRPDLTLPLSQRLLQLGEKNAQTYFYDGSAQAALGNIPAAISDFENASNLEPTNVGVLGELTQLYLKTNRPTDAERIANRSITFNKTDARAYVNLGLVYATEKKFDDARKQFETAYSLENKDVTPLLQEAQTYQSQNALASALTVVQRALATDPRNVQALVFKADLIAQQHLPAASAAAFDDAVAAAPDENTKVGILIQKAAMYSAEKQPAQAQAVFDAAVRDYPRVSGAHTAYGEYWISLRQPAKAIAQFQAAIQVNKDDAGALLDLGQISLATRKYSDAVGYLRRVTQLSPSAQSFALLGQAYISTHNYNAAKEACRQSFLAQRTPDTLGCIAGSDFSLKNYAEAGRIFDILDHGVKQYLDRNPQLLYMMGVSYSKTNQNAKAISAYTRLLKNMRVGTKEYRQVQQAITALGKPGSAPKKAKHA
ncbi:MAG: tetratricopeptide repeat protein [Candidatus Eremiobacteraeota bacterium]|nr:tetratricopeptide repeat protein [Candidatus Eremiobacteraeota bacterium]